MQTKRSGIFKMLMQINVIIQVHKSKILSKGHRQSENFQSDLSDLMPRVE